MYVTTKTGNRKISIEDNELAKTNYICYILKHSHDSAMEVGVQKKRRWGQKDPNGAQGQSPGGVSERRLQNTDNNEMFMYFDPAFNQTTTRVRCR